MVGGISLGSAVAVNVALGIPIGCWAWSLSRPAWIDRPLPENVALYTTIARLIRELGPEEGLAAISVDARVSGDGTRVAGLRPFARRPVRAAAAEECVARLERLTADTPCLDRALTAI